MRSVAPQSDIRKAGSCVYTCLLRERERERERESYWMIDLLLSSSRFFKSVYNGIGTLERMRGNENLTLKY